MDLKKYMENTNNHKLIEKYMIEYCTKNETPLYEFQEDDKIFSLICSYM